MDSNAVVTTGGVVGLLGGAIVFLFKVLIDSKNVRINELLDERDYWRDLVMRNVKDLTEVKDYETWFKEQHPAQHEREKRVD